MLVVNDMPDQVSLARLERMKAVETATIGHILHHGFIDRAVGPVISGVRVVGTAITVRIAGADSAMLHHAISVARPGDIIVVDRCADTLHACIGGVTARASKLAGVGALVIDGPATDFAEIRRVGMPVWCTGQTSLTTKFLRLDSAINVPVSVGGVAISPGDLIVADEFGVVAMAPDYIDDVASRALAMQQGEHAVLERLEAGERLDEISGARKLLFEPAAG